MIAQYLRQFKWTLVDIALEVLLREYFYAWFFKYYIVLINKRSL